MKTIQGVVLTWQFTNPSNDVKLEGVDQEKGYFHYFRGNDTSRHYVDIPIFREIAYRGLWSGIDLVIQGNKERIKFDWLLQPGSRVEDIRFICKGSDAVRLNDSGELLFCTPYGELTDLKPIAFQEINGNKKILECRYVLIESTGNSWTIGYELTEEYDGDHPLVIDPAIIYSTFLGGSGFEEGLAIAVDDFGHAYVTGSTTSTNFPLTPGAFQTTMAGVEDVFVTKLNQTGTGLLYSTYLGGSSLDSGSGIAVDHSGYAYVTGFTLSADFPTTPGVIGPVLSGTSDGFVTKLGPDGNFLVYSTYLGGSGSDDGIAIAVDDSGNAYITGQTDSADFPTTPGSFMPTNSATVPIGFVTKLNATGTALVYSTYLGGNGTTNGNGIAVDTAGNAFVAGQTVARNFPTTPGAYQITLAGGIDAFATKLNAAGSALIYSTLLGGSQNDDAEDIAIDDAGNAYVVGHTSSANYPTTPGALVILGGSQEVFVTKLNPTGTSLIYSSVFGGNAVDTPYAIAVDDNRRAYVTGATVSSNFPVTPDAFQPSRPGSTDAFISVLDPTGSYLEYSTYLGGSASSDAARGIAVDHQHNIYVAGTTFSFDFPTTPGVFQPFLNVIDAFVTKFGEEAVLFVNKFSDRFEVRPGEVVFFFIEISNGPVPLSNIAIDDPMLGFFTVFPELPPFHSTGFQLEFVVPPDTPPGPIVNTVFVKADQLRDPIVAEAVVIVTENPILAATKSVTPSAAKPGETVIFHISITNHGNVELANVRLIDPLLGLDQTIGNIPVGGSINIDWPFEIPLDAQVGFTIANVLQISADNLPQPERVGTVVEVLPAPRLSLEKSADRIVVLPGETLNFSVTLTNSGNIALTNITVTDDLAGFSFDIPSLAAGQTESFQLPFLVPLEVPPRVYTNTAMAISDQTAPVYDTADVTVLAAPQIGIRKLPELSSVSPGQTFTYTIVLNNIGNVPLTAIHLVDSLLGVDLAAENLAVGGRHEFHFPYTVPQDTLVGTELINELTVRTSEAGTQQVIASVTVVGTGLSLSKTADRALAAPGETVNYTLSIENLTVLPQTNLALNDPLLGISETVASLAAGATITRSGSYTVPAVAVNGSVIVNTFTAASDQTPLQEAAADVVVRTDPDATTTLAVKKLPDRNVAAPGETIRYTVEITNTGANPATNVTVFDSLTGTQNTIAVIAPGETALAEYTFPVSSTALQGTVFANRVTVDWLERPEDTLPVQSEARVVVGLPATLLELIVEAAPPVAKPGDTVSKIIRITNKSDRVLTNIRGIDLLVRFNTVIPVLAPGENRVFTLPFTIPADTVGGTTFLNNVAVFSNQSPLQQAAVVITAQALPSAVLTETVNRPEGSPGDTVIFTIRLRNTGNVGLLNTRLTAPLLHFQFFEPNFEVGADEIIRIPYVLPETDEDIVITSPVTVVADNITSLHASASVRVIVEEE
ncbi:SBBP repeat-containing protein [Paenibacillus sp. NPDC058174]|uniref:SBBP repeat-containing protein n=1 Tax=Paenibacillus sp. NPDC058174 TaxID=3346366 RepID=UPI0036DF74C2